MTRARDAVARSTLGRLPLGDDRRRLPKQEGKKPSFPSHRRILPPFSPPIVGYFPPFSPPIVGEGLGVGSGLGYAACQSKNFFADRVLTSVFTPSTRLHPAFTPPSPRLHPAFTPPPTPPLRGVGSRGKGWGWGVLGKGRGVVGAAPSIHRAFRTDLLLH